MMSLEPPLAQLLLLLLLIENASSRRSPSAPAENGEVVFRLFREKKGNFLRCRRSLLRDDEDGLVLSVVFFMLLVADAVAVS